MLEILQFKTIFTDTQPLKEKRILHFFNSNEEFENKRIISLTEELAVEWLFQNGNFINLFYDELLGNSENVFTKFKVREPFTIESQKPGDIDLLLLRKESPFKSIGIECKVVTSKYENENYSKVNKINKLRNGIEQANSYLSLGFHKVFLMIIILDDASKDNTTNVFYRNSENAEFSKVYNIHWCESLKEEVGVIYLNILQPTGKSYELSNHIGFCISKEAKPLEQSQDFTNKLIKVFNI